MSYTFKNQDVKLAWVAGFFDGEGCVMIHRRERGNFIEHYVTAVVGQKERRPLEFLQSEFGGILSKLTTSGCYQWRAHGATAERFYKVIRPFSQTKCAEIECALEVRQTVGLPSRKLKAGVWLIREEIWQRFRALRAAKKCITS